MYSDISIFLFRNLQLIFACYKVHSSTAGASILGFAASGFALPVGAFGNLLTKIPRQRQ